MVEGTLYDHFEMKLHRKKLFTNYLTIPYISFEQLLELLKDVLTQHPDIYQLHLQRLQSVEQFQVTAFDEKPHF